MAMVVIVLLMLAMFLVFGKMIHDNPDDYGK